MKPGPAGAAPAVSARPGGADDSGHPGGGTVGAGTGRVRCPGPTGL